MKILLLLFLLPSFLLAQGDQYSQFVLSSSLPSDLSGKLSQSGFLKEYDLNVALNPFYLRGDFNGDEKMDYAIAVTDKQTKKRGIAIFTSQTDFVLIGAGNSLPNRKMDDFGWMDAWYVYSNRTVEIGAGETEELKLTTDAIMAVKTESASGLIYWNGKEFRWYQQGD
ncbi:MAG: hypothetical protein RIF40_22685 [Imperialibacter sp.]